MTSLQCESLLPCHPAPQSSSSRLIPWRFKSHHNPQQFCHRLVGKKAVLILLGTGKTLSGSECPNQFPQFRFPVGAENPVPIPFSMFIIINVWRSWIKNESGQAAYFKTAILSLLFLHLGTCNSLAASMTLEILHYPHKVSQRFLLVTLFSSLKWMPAFVLYFFATTYNLKTC